MLILKTHSNRKQFCIGLFPRYPSLVHLMSFLKSSQQPGPRETDEDLVH